MKSPSRNQRRPGVGEGPHAKGGGWGWGPSRENKQ